MKRLINLDKSIIPSCDVPDLEDLTKLVKNTCNVKGIGGYKVGLELVISYGLEKVVQTIKSHTSLPVIYDHQKGGTDIPNLGIKFAQACKRSGADAVILFPFGGKATEETWIKACNDNDLPVIVGAHMTQKQFLFSEKGFIADEAPQKIFEIALKNNVTDFVVPGNKADLVFKYKKQFDSSAKKYVLYAPGFISQGGKISECGHIAGNYWHAIVGSAIYNAEDMQKAATELAREIVDS
jgi:orotidine-5'-phosphate decarboxylase